MPIKILVADDSVTIQKVVELAFTPRGARVFSTGHGGEAADRIRECDPDIALLDVVIPGTDGYELCRQLKGSEETSWIPVVLLAGSFEPFDADRARDVGADGSIRKPFQTRDLLDMVDRLLASHPRPGGRPEADEPVSPPEAPVPEAASIPGAREEGALPAESASAELRPASGPDPAADPGRETDPEDLRLRDAARSAVTEVAESIVREIAWEVIPDLAEAIIRKRIEELESEAERRSEK